MTRGGIRGLSPSSPAGSGRSTLRGVSPSSSPAAGRGAVRGGTSSFPQDSGGTLNLNQIQNAQQNLVLIDTALNEIRQLLLQKESLRADVEALQQRKAVLTHEVATLSQQQTNRSEQRQQQCSASGASVNHSGNVNHSPYHRYGRAAYDDRWNEDKENEEDEDDDDEQLKRRSSAPDLTSFNMKLYGVSGVYGDDDNEDGNKQASDARNTLWGSNKDDDEEEEEITINNGRKSWRRHHRTSSIASLSSRGSMIPAGQRMSLLRSAGGGGGGGAPVAPPQRFVCPLTWEIMKFPMLQKGTNKHYERGAILEWIYFGKATDPLTRQKLHPSDFELNESLQQEIQQWCQEYAYVMDNDDEDDEDLSMTDESNEDANVVEDLEVQKQIQRAKMKRKLVRTLTPDQERAQQRRVSLLQVKRQGSTKQLMTLKDRILQKRDDRIRNNNHNNNHNHQSSSSSLRLGR